MLFGKIDTHFESEKAPFLFRNKTIAMVELTKMVENWNLHLS
jgi:hypothetical protein